MAIARLSTPTGPIELSYEAHGDSEAVVLLVAGHFPASVWHPVAVPMLTGAGYRVVTFDNRGMPPSTVPEPGYQVSDLAADTAALIEHLSIDPCHLVGASLGGLITQTLALARPDLVATASFIAGTGDYSAGGKLAMAACHAAYASGAPAATMAAAIVAMAVPVPLWHDQKAVDAAMSAARSTLTRDNSTHRGRLGHRHCQLGHDHDLFLFRDPKM
ncbi:MAG: alpha/beta fold hydrolase [Streptosporangiaceae bacterium]|nr:alpha/beta fold hydrolase [Streptosporangiaceae bacterium]